jgi:hypothetical protein
VRGQQPQHQRVKGQRLALALFVLVALAQVAQQLFAHRARFGELRKARLQVQGNVQQVGAAQVGRVPVAHQPGEDLAGRLHPRRAGL